MGIFGSSTSGYTNALLLQPPLVLAGRPVCPSCHGATTLGQGTTMDWGTDHCKRCKLWWPYHCEGHLAEPLDPPDPKFATYKWLIRPHGPQTGADQL